MPQLFVGRMETFLTCVKISQYLKNNLLNEATGKFFEETSLVAVHKTLLTNIDVADIRLLLSELPNILVSPYSIVNDIRIACIELIPQFIKILNSNYMWYSSGEFIDMLEMLKAFDAYKKI